MKPDKANTMECPYAQRKCKADKCMAWETEFCILIMATKILPTLFLKQKEKEEICQTPVS